MARWGSCDYSELKKFQQKLEKLANSEIDKFCKDVAKELAQRLLRKVIYKTPTRNLFGRNLYMHYWKKSSRK